MRVKSILKVHEHTTIYKRKTTHKTSSMPARTTQPLKTGATPKEKNLFPTEQTLIFNASPENVPTHLIKTTKGN